MHDFLMRDEAPLSSEEWEQLDDLVVKTAKKKLVGRRLVEVFGPVGVGLQTISVDRYNVSGACLHTGTAVSCGDDGHDCQGDCDVIEVAEREILQLPFIHKDFVLRWRDIATNRQFGLPMDFGPAAAAAAVVSRKEDEMILGGLLGQAGTNVALGDSDQAGSLFQSIVDATSVLAEAGFFGPYALATSPGLYAKMHRPLQGGMGMLAIKQIRELAGGGVYQTPALTGDQAIMISQGRQNLDLVVAQDLSTAYLGPDRMEHYFRVMESVALRVKRPEAICVIG
jgi:uncharacterized linocin/CFP29 family protein